jgi:hypothetical protein
MLPSLDNYGARNITESALGLVAGQLHHVVGSPNFEAFAKNRPDLLQTLMDRVRERDSARRWDAYRQSAEIARLETVLQRREEMDKKDNSFMRNQPFPYAVIALGVGFIFAYYQVITKLPKDKLAYIPLMNVVAVTAIFIMVVRQVALG